MRISVIGFCAVSSLLFPLTASAVHVMGNTANNSAPVDDPGFANIGSLNSATGIYLGNGWVLTARHVGEGTVVLQGVPYAPVSGSKVDLNNNGSPLMTSQTDLIMFQINGDPGLPSLTISATPPILGTDLVMIGNGVNQAAARTNYTVTPVVAGNDLWSPGGPVELFEPVAGNTIRWGTNDVEYLPQSANSGFGDVWSFGTRFNDDLAGRPNEAQAVLGDSGSAAFWKSGASWILAGMTHSVGNAAGYDNVPGGVASSIVGESLTFMADLSFYRSQIVSTMAVPEPGSVMLTALGLAGFFRRRRPGCQA